MNSQTDLEALGLKTHYTLIIKARAREALVELKARGLHREAVIVRETEYGETIARAPVTTWERLHDWFAEDSGRQPPFPVGALLYFG